MITITIQVNDTGDGLLHIKTEVRRSGPLTRKETATTAGLLQLTGQFQKLMCEKAGDAQIIEREVKVKDIPHE